MTEKQLAREYHIKTYMYRIMFYGLFFTALLVFVWIYNKFVDGSPYVLIRNPVMLLYLLMPFIPPFFFLYLSFKAQDKRNKALGERNTN